MGQPSPTAVGRLEYPHPHILTGKELELVEEAKRYHFDIIGVSSTKRRGSGTVDLDGRWKLF